MIDLTDDVRDDRNSSYGLAILGGMQGKPMYAGTVHPDEISRRRRANRQSRRSRQINRAAR